MRDRTRTQTTSRRIVASTHPPEHVQSVRPFNKKFHQNLEKLPEKKKALRRCMSTRRRPKDLHSFFKASSLLRTSWWRSSCPSAQTRLRRVLIHGSTNVGVLAKLGRFTTFPLNFCSVPDALGPEKPIGRTFILGQSCTTTERPQFSPQASTSHHTPDTSNSKSTPSACFGSNTSVCRQVLPSTTLSKALLLSSSRIPRKKTK